MSVYLTEQMSKIYVLAFVRKKLLLWIDVKALTGWVVMALTQWGEACMAQQWFRV